MEMYVYMYVCIHIWWFDRPQHTWAADAWSKRDVFITHSLALLHTHTHKCTNPHSLTCIHTDLHTHALSACAPVSMRVHEDKC